MTGTSRIDRRGFLRNAGSAALGAAAAGSIAQLTPSALAQEKFPARDINWIIYQAPGGSIDTTARIIQPYLEKHGVKTSLTMSWERAGESHARSSTPLDRTATL